jgi:aspartyl-tRNA(Asn)/glutamyl-tRNA(Gln) amidotransferase subunit B
MSKLVEGRTGSWEIVIGMEVHAQVISKAKLFSGASTIFGAEPNAQVSPVDAGMPGMLPVINRVCVEQAVRTGLGLNAKINLISVFDRKNYFYPDLPAGYQISQYLQPIVGKGEIEIDLPDGSARTVGITRLHLEQDAGKSLHDQHPQLTFVDLNRSGVALMEIVSEPDLRSAEEAGAYLAKLRTILRYLGTCDGNMDEGSMRADVNVSVRKPGADLGTRCEIKNVNSVRFVMQAVEYEARRQIEILEDGGKIAQETRLFDTSKGVTRSMRSKEEAHDYRYFPDPDLLPLKLDANWVEAIRRSLPELPDAKKARFARDYGLSVYDAGVLVAERARADYFETVAKGRDGKQVANWVTVELFGLLNKAGLAIERSPVSAAFLGELIDRVQDATLQRLAAKDLLAEKFGFESKLGLASLAGFPSMTVAQVIEAKGLKQVSDTGALEKAIDEVMAKNADKVAEYRSGKDKLFGFFVGQVMRESQGKANPAVVNELLKKKLAS